MARAFRAMRIAFLRCHHARHRLINRARFEEASIPPLAIGSEAEGDALSVPKHIGDSHEGPIDGQIDRDA